MASWTPVHAQITIPETVISSRLGTTQSLTLIDYSLTNDFSAILAAVGPNQTWDFSGFNVMDTLALTLDYLPATSDIPGNELPQFENANFVTRSEQEAVGLSVVGYVHQRLENGVYHGFGTTTVGDTDMDGVVDTFHTFLDPPELLEVFPLEFGQTWMDSTSTRFSTAPDLVISIEETDSEVDGWGTVITDYGTFDALRSTTILADINPFTFITTINTFVDFLMPDGSVIAISIDDEGQIFGAVYTLSTGTTGTSTENDEQPAGFALQQNFPNPFNPSTRIAYNIPEATDVQLKVYTVTGQEIATLVNGVQAAGRHEVVFDATNLASGRYFYRLQAGGKVQSRVMNLVK